jgi:hypothetical protein
MSKLGVKYCTKVLHVCSSVIFVKKTSADSLFLQGMASSQHKSWKVCVPSEYLKWHYS